MKKLMSEIDVHEYLRWTQARRITRNEMFVARIGARHNYFRYLGYLEAPSCPDNKDEFDKLCQDFASLLGCSSYDELCRSGDEKVYENLKKYCGPYYKALFAIKKARLAANHIR